MVGYHNKYMKGNFTTTVWYWNTLWTPYTWVAQWLDVGSVDVEDAAFDVPNHHV